VGGPNALAQMAEARERAALSMEEPSARNSALLEAFAGYAAAAELARTDNLADEVWREWRHRRAALARQLAKEGLMQQVAARYLEVYRH
jgi:hypothetical protein